MYSRRLKTEEARNKRWALVFIILTVGSVLLLITYGLPGIAKFAAFLTELRQSSEPVESSDITPPPPPRLNLLPKATNEEKIEVSGATEPGATVTILLNDDEEEILANSEGQFSLSLTLSEETNTLSARATDKQGNASQFTETHTIIFDKVPPKLEISKPKDGSEFFGSNQRQIVFEGLTEEDAQVQINNRFVVVEPDGTFTFATTLAEGENEFNIKAEDASGNKTETTLKVRFTP